MSKQEAFEVLAEMIAEKVVQILESRPAPPLAQYGDMMTKGQVARELGVSVRQVTNIVSNGDLPLPKYDGKHAIFPKGAVIKLMKEKPQLYASN